MVEIKMKRTRQAEQPQKQQQPQQRNKNPYAGMDSLAVPGALPMLDQKDKAKMGKSMQRRISVHYTDGPQIRGLTGGPGSAPALPKELLAQYQQQGTSSTAPGSSGAPSGSTMLLDDVPKRPTEPQRQPQTTVRPQRLMDLHDPSVIRLLGDADFDADTFISTRLADATATDIERFNTQLAGLNSKIQEDIKANAVQTFEKLKNASKELNTTTSELKFLRTAINELSDITNQMKETAEKRVQSELDHQNELTKSKSMRRQATRVKDRSSILVLEKMWATEMNSLFKHVEGAQKFIAAIPGRHIIAESGRWYELNAATFKVLQPAHLFLLNDLILIATRKRKTGKAKADSKQQMLVADQCWPLREVQLTELKSSIDGKQTYAINITYNSLSYVYQTDRLDHYRKVMDGYKKARDELREVVDAESSKQKQLRDSLNMLALSENGGSGNGTPSRLSYHQSRNSQLILQDLSTRMHSRSRSTDNSGTLRTLKRLDDSIDEVDVLIFHENFDETLDRLDELETELQSLKASCNKEELMLHSVSKLKISTKKDQVLKKLIDTMRQREISPLSMELSIRCLIKLNQKEIAKTLFLNNRSHYIETLISNVTEEKDLTGKVRVKDYIVSVTIVKFQNIRTTIALYKHLFEGHYQSLSYLVDWALTEVKNHIEFLKGTLNNVKLTKPQLESTILLIHRQVVQLKQSGLDVEYLLDEFYRSIDTE